VNAFTSAVSMVFGSALTLMTFALEVLVAHFNLWDQFFFTFFKSFKLFSSDLQFRFTVYVWGFGLGVRFRVMVYCRFRV